MEKIHISTLNVRGLKNNQKRRSCFQLLRKGKYDIIALQECHISTNQEAEQWEIQWGGKLFCSLGSSHRLGQIFLVANKWTDRAKCIYKDDRLLIIKLNTDNRTLLLANMYAPQYTPDKIKFLNHVRDIIEELNEEDYPIIILGDANTVMNNTDDIITGEKHDKRETEALNKIVSQLDLHDTWRMQHPTEKQYTWNRSNPFTARRLDYIFASSILLPFIENSHITSFPHSDHRLVSTSLTFYDYNKGPSFWKFNNSLLKDIHYTQHLNDEIDHFKAETTTIDPNSKWELFKIRVREITITYCQNKQRKLRTQIQADTAKLNEMESELANNPQKPNLKAEITKIKTKLEVESLAKARGAQIRSRIKFIEEGEKNTAYFFNLEKRKGSANTITHLQNEEGLIISDQASVLNEQVKFYTKLYKKDPVDDNRDSTYITDFLGANSAIPTLDDLAKQKCETHINETEISEALKQLKNGSAPGSDGLTTEFYKYFWLQIKTMLIDSYLHSFNNKHMSQTQCKGIVKLIHKGKDLPREELANWRPITLLNTDYKILAKTIAMKISMILPTLIAEDQCGFIKGRNIATVIRTTDDAINFLKNNKLPGILVGVDFTKAFDTISKQFIKDSIEEYGFGPNFQQYIETLLAQTDSSIIHHGWISAPFKVERGIRQGCPLSPLLFVLAVEILAIKIRNSKDIKGITTIARTENAQTENALKIQQFADDTTLYLKDKEDLGAAINIFQSFATISGLEVNQQKTEAMWLGRNKHSEHKYYDLKWVKQIKILGIYFRSDTSALCNEENWNKKIENMRRIMKQWSRRNLSIYGKILITKTLLISQFIYIMQSIGIPEDILTTINRELYTFVWKKKYNNKKAFEKVKRKALMLDTSKGGLNMLDIKLLQEALLLTWVPKLIDDTVKGMWKIFPERAFSTICKDYEIFTTPSTVEDINRSFKDGGPFWTRVLHSWIHFKNRLPQEENNSIYLNSSIWNNGNFRYKGNTLHMKDWIAKGVYNINDIVNDTGDPITYPQIEQTIGNAPHRILEHNAIFTALKQAQRQNRLHMINNDQLQPENIKINQHPIQSLKCKDFRALLIDDIKPCALNFWKRKLNIDITPNHWQMAFDCTTETRLRVLQWKILHNIYPTNILLNKMGISNSNKCSACQTDDKDFIEHFFFHCSKVKPLWAKAELEINATIGKRITITEAIALLGYHDNNVSNTDRQIINHIIMLSKMCISKYRYGESVQLGFTFERELMLRKIINIT